MKAKSTRSLKKFLEHPREIAIVTHWSPDGDAIGSSLALWNYLIKCGHKATVCVPNDYPEFLHWMKGHNKIVNAQLNPKKATSVLKKAELIFCLDFNDISRINMMGNVISSLNTPVVMIDHHPQPMMFAQYALHKVSASSTAELIYDFIHSQGGAKLIDKDIANCLYTGIMTDTGSFRFPSTTAHTHRIVANLIRAGAENATNHNRIYDDNSEGRLRLLGFALSQRLTVIPELHTAFFVLSNEDHEKFNYKKGDTEGLVNYALTMKGIVFAAFFAERDGVIKCSFRSKGNFDVNVFARAHFNGGGHKNAAGGASNEKLEAVVKKFKSLLPEYATQLKKA
ncbi:MAG: bifunctional oligoribonuclease/PAP phosphatase NrnA [Bacteroidia bacterium]